MVGWGLEPGKKVDDEKLCYKGVFVMRLWYFGTTNLSCRHLDMYTVWRVRVTAASQLGGGLDDWRGILEYIGGCVPTVIDLMAWI